MRWGRSQGYFYSLSTGVVIGDRIFYEYHQNSTPDKLYSLASVTKMYTTYAVLLLADRKQIHLDDPVKKYLPSLIIERTELKSDPVTIRNLLTHTSGIPDIRYMHCENWMEPEQTGLPFRIPAQHFPNGVTYRYSNFGFMILGEIIQQVSGLSLDEFYAQNIFEAHSMPNAKFGRVSTGAAGLMNSFNDISQYAILWANRTRVSNSEQAEKFTLNAKLYNEIFEPLLIYPETGGLLFTGLGWRMNTSDNGDVFTFYHVGGANGTMAWLQIFPRYNAALFYLGNPPELTNEVLEFQVGLQHRLGDIVTAHTRSSEPVYAFKKKTPENEICKRMSGLYRSMLSNQDLPVECVDGEVIIEFRKNLKERLIFRNSRVGVGIRSNRKYDFYFAAPEQYPQGVSNHEEFFVRTLQSQESD